MKKVFMVLVGFLILISCSQTSNKKMNQENQPENAVDFVVADTFPALQEGILNLSDEAFGDVIELKGVSHPVDQIFRVSETEMIAKDSLLIMKNMHNENVLMLFTLPDFRFLKSIGRYGKGPDEFQYPLLVNTNSDQILCYIYERINEKFYALDRNLEICRLPTELPDNSDKPFGDKQIYAIDSSELYYVESTKRGKAMFHLSYKNDSVSSVLIKDLSFSDEHKNWAAYIGDFGANPEKKRLVYAYKYFKRLVFVDYESMKSRTIIFEAPKVKNGSATSILAPENVTYYWGMSAQRNFLYVLYSGRTPVEVSKELKNSPGTIYVEQFDWNGNPVRKFRLDHWGYFCVNEQENTIYMTSTTVEQPFVSYKLPSD